MVDILIVGSGPAGLSAAVYAKRANLDVLVVEKVFMGTGQITESKQVDNYLGIPGINGYDLGEKFRGHASLFGVEFKNAEAVRFEKADGKWKVFLQDGEVIETKTVIYAAGARHRQLEIPGEQDFAGRGVSYCATCDGAFFRGRTTAVIGGGDTALDDALYLSELAKKVYLIHRRDGFRGSAKTLELLQRKENVEFLLAVTPQEVIGEVSVEALLLSNGMQLEVDGVFVAVGMQPVTDALREVVELDSNGYIVADESGTTSAEGFFAAGDVRTKLLRQVITAVSDGANAATSAEQYIRKTDSAVS